MYVLIGPDYPPPPDSPVLMEQNVKSAFELPFPAELPAGRHILHGRSWSGSGEIQRVDVSIDGGNRWVRARLRPPNLPEAWVRWEVEWHARPGHYKLVARATDETGQVQPAVVPFNQLGYVFWATVLHPVSVF
jgi:hypothetical protein